MVPAATLPDSLDAAAPARADGRDALPQRGRDAGDVHPQGQATAIAALGIAGEVVVADNGSTDGSQDIARAEGARVVDVAEQGLRRRPDGRHRGGARRSS